MFYHFTLNIKYIYFFKIDEIFNNDMAFGMSLLFQGKAIFTKLYTLPLYFTSMIPYEVSSIPGFKEGITTGILTGFNIGIDGDIPKEKIESAIIALKYLTSKEVQKKYFIKENAITSIPSLYDDEEICQAVDCDFYRNIQFTVRPSSKYYAYSDLNQRIEKYIYQHLYGNQTAEYALKKLEDLTKIHYVSFKEKESHYGLALSVFIVVITLSFLMVGSLLLLLSKKLSPFFSYLSIDSWIILIFGLVIIISNCYTTLGPLTSIKCHLYIVFTVFGYTLNITPILHKLIIDFPDEKKIPTWTKKHKYVFFMLFIVYIIILLALFSLKGYKVQVNIIEEGENFETCKIKNALGFTLLFIILISFLIVIFIILLLCYVEWGLKTVIYDLHVFIISIYIDSFCLILLFIFEYIAIKNYIIQFIIKNLLTLIPVITNYITIYGFRLYLPFYKINEENDVNTLMSYCSKNGTQSFSATSSTKGKKNHFIMKLRDYHVQTILDSRSQKCSTGILNIDTSNMSGIINNNIINTSKMSDTTDIDLK